MLEVYENPEKIVDLYKKHGLRACTGQCTNMFGPVTHCCARGLIAFDSLPEDKRNKSFIESAVYKGRADGGNDETSFEYGVRSAFDGVCGRYRGNDEFNAGYDVGKKMREAVIEAGLFDKNQY